MARAPLLILSLLLQACGTMRLRPLPDPSALLDHERHAISRRMAGVDVTVQAEAWHYRPGRLTNDFLPFLVRIVNQGHGDVTLRFPQVSLIDDQDRIRRPLKPEEVASLLLGGSDGSAIMPSIGLEATGPEPTLFGIELGLNWGRNRDLRDIRRLAFSPEPIPAGSHAEGFIYFPNPPSDARRLTLILILDAPSGRHQLPFPFAVEN